MILNFLNTREAVQELTSSTYLKEFKRRELLVRLLPFYSQTQLAKSNRESMRSLLFNIYLNSVTNFDSLEIRALQFYFMKIKQSILEKGAQQFFLPTTTVSLIKLQDHASRLDWGYLFTINSSIVIPVSHLNIIVNNYRLYLNSQAETSEPCVGVKADYPDNTLIETTLNNLYHETLHILQRSGDHVCPRDLCIRESKSLLGNTLWQSQMNLIYGSFFNYLYKNLWNMEPICKDQLQGVRRLDRSLIFITNPDGPNFQWITKVKINNKFETLLPALIYDQEKQKPKGVLIVLYPQTTVCGANKYMLTDRVYNINDIKEYNQRFYGLKQQLYHPNEISAQLMSDYLISDKLWGNHFDSLSFYQYIQKFMLSGIIQPSRDEILQGC